MPSESAAESESAVSGSVATRVPPGVTDAVRCERWHSVDVVRYVRWHSADVVTCELSHSVVKCGSL